MYVLPHVAVATSNLPYLKYSQMTLTGESSFSAVWGLKLNFYILHKTILQLFKKDFTVQEKSLLKGRCHEILTIFCLKDSTWAPYEPLKTFLLTFFSPRYSRKTYVSVVNNYAYIHCVSIVDVDVVAHW